VSAYELDPGEYDAEPNEHGALRAIETQLMRLEHIAQAIADHGVAIEDALSEQAEAQRRIADAISRLADVMAVAVTGVDRRVVDFRLHEMAAERRRQHDETRDVTSHEG
jgi:hypothetical protein